MLYILRATDTNPNKPKTGQESVPRVEKYNRPPTLPRERTSLRIHFGLKGFANTTGIKPSIVSKLI